MGRGERVPGPDGPVPHRGAQRADCYAVIGTQNRPIHIEPAREAIIENRLAMRLEMPPIIKRLSANNCGLEPFFGHHSQVGAFVLIGVEIHPRHAQKYRGLTNPT